jgi:hypothetical protein
MGSMGPGRDAQTPNVFQSRMLLAHICFERVVQAMVTNFHVTVQQRRGKELHLLARETRALLVTVCGQLSSG